MRHSALYLVIIALAAAASMGAHAQTGGNSVQDFQLDPARDPNRPQPPERAGPEIERLPTAPVPGGPPPVTTTAPPVQLPTPAPVPEPAPTRSRPPAAERPTPRVAAPAAPAVAPVQTRPAGAVQDDAAQEPAAVPQREPAVAEPAPAPATAPVPEAAGDAESGWPLWLFPVGLASAALLAFLLFRRARPARGDAIAAEPAPPPVAAEPPRAPQPPAPAPRRREEERPWLQIEFHAESARSTLVGAAVAYRLTLRNNGTRVAEQVSVSALLTNATAQQPALLAAFFGAPVDQPVHQVAALQPGEAVEMRGELRIDHGAIVPIRVQERALLIPVVGFNAVYRWPADDGAPGEGRTGAAFIVGQESDPPREKMAPFRLDQGPRQYRSVGSRPAQQAQLA